MKRKYNAAKTRVKSFLYDRRREALQSRSQSPAPTDSHPDQVSPAPLVPLSYGAIRNEGLLPLLPMSRLSTQSELVENISLPRRPTDLESIPLKPPSRHTRRYSSDSSIREPKSVASTASSIVLAPFSPSQHYDPGSLYDVRRGLSINQVANDKREVLKTIKIALGHRFAWGALDYMQSEGAGCMLGTRLGVLSMFMDWVKYDPRHVFWLTGLAGMGKTSIAITLCRRIRDAHDLLLGGAFFCSRTSDLNKFTDARCILPTLAESFAEHSSKFAAALAAELEVDSLASFQPISIQIATLLQRPLSSFGSSSCPIVFLIDGLDECSDKNEVQNLLQAISAFTCEATVKFIITSRPETHIITSPISNSDRNEIVQLHTIDMQEITEDIRLYFTETFSRYWQQLDKAWYTESDVDKLVNRANGLFSFASAVATYILDVEDVERSMLRLRIATSTPKDSKVATEMLDYMYESVVSRATDSAKIDPGDLATAQQVLACILVARVPLSIATLAELLERAATDIRELLLYFSAVVYLPDNADDPGLRTIHESFDDYMLERATTEIRISASLGNEILARNCIRMMRNGLHFNVSHSCSSHKPNSPTKPDNVTPALEYACTQWSYHLAGISQPWVMDDDINEVFRPRFLFWLEVMSISGQVRRATAMLAFAAATVQLPDLSQFLYDASSFVASFRKAIERSAPHIYLSALPLSDKDSLIYKDFIQHCINVVSVHTFGVDRGIDRLVSTLTGHELWVCSVAYSPDGRLLASGSGDCTVRIWDTHTGEEAVPSLHSSDGAVRSVAFAPHSGHVAFGTDHGVVHIWDIGVGRTATVPLHGHTDTVWSVVYAPANAALIASASEDGTVRLWNPETGSILHVLSGHTRAVRAIAFRPDGQLVASGSKDKTVRLWNTFTGESAGEPITGLGDNISSLAISAEGKTLAVGSMSASGVRVWDLETRQITVELCRLPVTSLSFASDGSYLASSGWQAIHFWDWRTGQEVAAPITCSDWVNSVSFSSDGSYLSSATSDCTVQIWRSGGDRSAVRPPVAHDGAVTSIAVSADGTFIVSGSEDCSVRIWNAYTAEQISQPLLGHSDCVLSVAISSDGHLIASASADRTIRRWSVVTHEAAGEPLRGHKGKVNAIAFSPDLRWIVSGSDDGTARMWNIVTGFPSTIGPLECNARVLAVSFSPNGRIFASGDSQGYIRIWQTETGLVECEPLQANLRNIRSVVFSPDGMHVVSGSEDRSVRVWKVGEQKHTSFLVNHTDWVWSAAYSPDGGLIVSSSEDKTIRIWDLETGTTLATLYGHEQRVRFVVFSTDGRSIVSCGDDGTIRVWDVATALTLPKSGADDLLADATLKGEWYVGPSHELLLWVPYRYHDYLQKPPCKLVIGRCHVIIDSNTGGSYQGDNWTACWRKSMNH